MGVPKGRLLRVAVLSDRVVHYSSYVRVRLPLGYLQDYEAIEYLMFGWHADHAETFAKKLKDCDICVWCLSGNGLWLQMMETLQGIGKPYVMDFDDFIWSTSPFNPAYGHLGTQEVAAVREDGVRVQLWQAGRDDFDPERNKRNLDIIRDHARRADAITTPTERLTDLMRPINQRTFTLPNCYDPDIWFPGRFPRPGFRILWQGGNSHARDVQVMAADLGRFVRETPSARVVFCGTEYEVVRREIPDAQYEFVDWVNTEAYPWQMMALGADVNICPLERTEFNNGKSPLKWVEASAQALPSLCSDTPPYSDYVEHEKDGVLVPQGGWYDALKRMYRDNQFRRQIAEGALARAEKEFTVAKRAGEWLDVYKHVLNKGVRGRPRLLLPAGAGKE